ncbi:hypothetical protein AB0N23_35245, partial [Streptomyces sp. NPDC052644]
FVIDKTLGFRVKADDEVEGIDISEHAESGYDLSPSTGGAGGGAFAMAGITPGGAKPASPEVPEPAAAPVDEKVAG